MIKYILIAVVVLGIILFILWLGLRVKPKPFSPFEGRSSSLETMPLPANLPGPVEHFYKTVYGESIPRITSAVVSGRASLRVSGITFPARFRFIHDAGQDYRHYIEVTFFGFPLMKVNERYLEGVSRMETPGGVIEDEPQINQAANLGLWAESIWLPSIFLSDPRVRWEAVDPETALLIVPFADREETFVARFDPQTGLLLYLESMRYKDSHGGKILWINEVRGWKSIDGFQLPFIGAVTWMDEGTPWAVFTVEEVVYNTDVSDYVRAEGP
jgi:hypothetical protein